MNTRWWEAGGWTALVGGNPTEPIGRSRVNNIDGQTERSNRAFGKSDIEGKTARVVARERGTRTSFKCAGAHESKRGQRTSFNRGEGFPR
jgi:hypothetical protein